MFWSLLDSKIFKKDKEDRKNQQLLLLKPKNNLLNKNPLLNKNLNNKLNKEVAMVYSTKITFLNNPGQM